MNKSRLEAFSDGVFAIVITLLNLDIHAPSSASLAVHDLRPLMPHVATFVLSSSLWVCIGWRTTTCCISSGK